MKYGAMTLLLFFAMLFFLIKKTEAEIDDFDDKSNLSKCVADLRSLLREISKKKTMKKDFHWRQRE